MIKKRFGPWHYFSALSVLYLALSLILPANQASEHQYHLSGSEYHILLFLITLPYVAIWLAAFYGSNHLKQYAKAINNTEEGSGFRDLTIGTRWLAWGLPIPALIGLVLGSIANSHSGFKGASVIIGNYVTLFMPLIAFSYMSRGSRQLLQKAKLQVSPQSAKFMVLGFVALGVVFCYFIFRNLNTLSASSTNSPYHLPTWLLILTLVIPYLYTWFIGLIAAYEMRLISIHAAGMLYRRGLQMLSRAIIIIIAASIAIQYIQAITRTNHHLSLGYVVVLIYLILLTYAVGFIVLAIGSNKLKKIEEV